MPDAAIGLPRALRERLLATITARLPQKSFGYLLSAGDRRRPVDFLLFDANIRNSEGWREQFESYGRYFQDHDDAGFVATAEESWRAQRDIWSRGLVEAGAFHSHLRHPANFSGIDFDLHTQRFPRLWHLIVSMRNAASPQLRIFDICGGGVRELPIDDGSADSRESPDARHARYGPDSLDPSDPRAARGRPSRDAAIARARQVLVLDRAGRPACRDMRAVATAIEDLCATGDREAVRDLLTHGFLAGAAQRYDTHIAGDMRPLAGGTFVMGTPDADRRHFCGESPAHVVELSPFRMAARPVTNALLALMDDRRQPAARSDAQLPATGVSWYEASVFARWMGCRLPSEAEWEQACAAGSTGEWCCDERLLPRHAWYSENAGGTLRPVATREPNALGLYDLHGGVWEWCRDRYDQDFYQRSPRRDPVAAGAPDAHRVCRGGSLHALAEMCRTRYRLHEPPEFIAPDLGFRLARDETP